MKKLNYFLVFFSLFLHSTLSAQQNVDVLLIARNTGEKIVANGDTIRIFGFAQSLGAQPGVPGPTLTVNEGDSVHIDLWNVSQGAPHTIHLHGLDVDQQNDGVPHLSFDVGHMDHGFYHFKAPHAGTYLYHCHVASTIHVQAGMYGLIIVRPPNGGNTTWDGGIAYTEEHSYFLSEIDTLWHQDSVLLHEHDTSIVIHQVQIPKFDPQYFLINGWSDQQLVDEGVEFNSSVNQVDYVRLANIGYCGTRIIFPAGLNARIVDSDGRPLAPEEISDTVYVYPGERYGVITEAGAEFQGQIAFEYIDLNTMQTKDTQYVPVNISGFADLETLISNDFAIAFSPNPFSDNAEVNFTLAAPQNGSLQIVDMNGRVVVHFPTEFFDKGSQSIYLETSALKSGSYILQMNLEMQGTVRKKIVKI